MRAEDETRILAADRSVSSPRTSGVQVREFSIELNGASDHEFPDPAAMAVALDESLIVESDHRHMLVSTDEANLRADVRRLRPTGQGTHRARHHRAG